MTAMTSPPPTPGDSGSNGSKRPRSRTGCFTCRKRKKRCDEAKPTCGACSRLDLDCDYPQPGTERKNKRRKSISTNQPTKLQQQQADELIPEEEHPEDDTHLHTEGISIEQYLEPGNDPPPEFVSGLSPDTCAQIFGPFLEKPVESSNNIVATAVPSPTGLAPSVWQSLQQLDPVGTHLFDYFRDKLARLICVSTEDSNSFLNVFVPMAHEDDSVMYSLVAWAGFHKGKGQMQDSALYYLNRAIETNKHDKSVTSLASMLLVCSAEICSGDVMHWDKHLTAAAGMIKQFGGLSKFASDSRLRWLASNFAYHDLLASSTCARNTHFRSEEYDQIMKHGFGLDALIGCCQPLFKILAEISDLAVDSASTTVNTVNTIRLIRNRTQELEQNIMSCHPDPLDMILLNNQQLDEQLSLFECFQLTARIHLRQAVSRMNSGSIEMQCLNAELRDKLDRVLETRVEGGVVFPLFICGINCIDVESRKMIGVKFDRYYERNLARNIKRAKHLMEEVWNRDDFGSRRVDWYGIIQSRGWDICFA